MNLRHSSVIGQSAGTLRGVETPVAKTGLIVALSMLPAFLGIVISLRRSLQMWVL